MSIGPTLLRTDGHGLISDMLSRVALPCRSGLGVGIVDSLSRHDGYPARPKASRRLCGRPANRRPARYRHQGCRYWRIGRHSRAGFFGYRIAYG